MMKVWVDDRATRRRVGDLLVRREGLWVVIVGDGQWESDGANVIGVCWESGIFYSKFASTWHHGGEGFVR